LYAKAKMPTLEIAGLVDNNVRDRVRVAVVEEVLEAYGPEAGLLRAMVAVNLLEWWLTVIEEHEAAEVWRETCVHLEGIDSAGGDCPLRCDLG
jgi:hypothetical protein